ncbi:MAG: NYN domain-containing protein, partial [Verrucomicrobiota bacterium]|nr:NYN domain-containing protein [Verrucomicrobiota bacterium]
MIYLIDGYNLIFSLIQSKESLQTMRQKVIHYLQKRFAARKMSGTLVFDGAHLRDEESGLSYPSPLIVAYAPKGQSADEYIVEKIRVSKNAKQITVVTNDRGLAMHAKSAGAKVMENHAFITWLQKKKKRQRSVDVQESPKNIERLEKI